MTHFLVSTKAISKPLETTHTLADITISSHNGDLARKHDVGGPLDTVNEGLAAAVVVVELRLGHGVVDVNGRHLQLAITEHLVQVVDTSSGLLGKTTNA